MAHSHPARMTFTVSFKDAPKPLAPEPEARAPRVARMLALAHRIDQLIQTGELRDYADAAKVMGLNRARVTQIVNLLMLAPDIQEAILDLPVGTAGVDPITERRLRPIAAESEWTAQQSLCSQYIAAPV